MRIKRYPNALARDARAWEILRRWAMAETGTETGAEMKMPRSVSLSEWRFESSGHALHDAQGDDFLDDAKRLDGTFDAIGRELIERQALLVEAAKTGFVLKERTIGNVRAALEEFLDGAMQPDNGTARCGERFAVGGLSDSAPAERNNG